MSAGEHSELSIPLLISQEDRVRNVFLYGRPEGGRDKLLVDFLKCDIANGRGFTLIDPSGDIVKAIKYTVPQDKLVLFDLADSEGLWQLDYFDHIADSERVSFLATNNFVSILESAVLPTGKFSVETLKSLYKATLSASQLPEPSLAKIIDFLLESKEKEKLRQLVLEGLGKNVFNLNKKKLDLLSIMQNNQYLLCDFGKARIGEENAIFYGLLIIQMLQQVASARYGLPSDKRTVHQLYVNRFENYANKDIFASFISESRPLGINIHLVTESVYNLDRDMLGSIFGNFGNLICFKAGKVDAEILAKNIGLFVSSDFENLKANELILRLISKLAVTQPRKVMLSSTDESLETKIRQSLEDAKKSAKDIFETDLDFTVQSVEKLDNIANTFYNVVAKGGVKGIGGDEMLWKASWLYGCFLGEVIRKRWGGMWLMDKDKPDDKNALILNVHGNSTFPVFKVAKRITNGPEDSLVHYYNVLEQLLTNSSNK